MCKYCNGVINYGSKGHVAIIDHLKSGKDASEVDHRQSNYSLGAQFSQKNAAPALFPLIKPPPPPLKQLNPAKDLVPPPVSKLIPIVDRTANKESMVLSFMAENNLSFTLAPKLVDLLKECAADPKVLSSVSLTPCSAAYKLTYSVSLTPCSAAYKLTYSVSLTLCSAAYKLTYGVSLTPCSAAYNCTSLHMVFLTFLKTGIIESMCTQLFSLNIDEATTANNNKKVL